MSSFGLVVSSEDGMVVVACDLVDKDDVVNIGSVEACVVDEDVVVNNKNVEKDEVSCVVGVVGAAVVGSIKGIVESFVE